MAPEQILTVLAKYEAHLKEGRTAERFVGGFPKEGAFPTREASLRHVLWMCEQIRTQVAAKEIEKAMRWLGFIQGVLWSTGVYSINDMRDDNRS